MSIKDFAEKFMEAEKAAWMEGNVNALDEVDAPDVVYHLMPPSPDVVGRETHKEFIANERQAYTDIKSEWKYITGEGNLFAVFYTLSMLFTGVVAGQPIPTGKRASRSEMCLCRVEKDRIVEAWFAGSSSGLNEGFCV